MSNMGNKQAAVATAPEAQSKYVRSLLDDLRQQVDQLNVEKGQLSERASRLRGERDVLLENKGQLQQRVEQLEERVRHYKRHEHKLIEENKQIQMENDEERVKEMTHVYQQLQRVVHLLQKLGKQLNSKQKHQEVHVQIVLQLQEMVEEIQSELMLSCGAEPEKMEKLALLQSQNSPSTTTDSSEVGATSLQRQWWNSSPPPPPHPQRKSLPSPVAPPPSYRAYPHMSFPPNSLPLRRQLHTQSPIHRPLSMSSEHYYNMAVSTGNLLSPTQQLARGLSQDGSPLSHNHRVHFGSVHQV